MASWPAELPQEPERDGWEEKGPKLQHRTNMDAPIAKVRRRFTKGVRPLTMSFIMTAAETLILDDFYEENVGLSWDFFDPRTQTTRKYRFTDEPIVYKNIGGITYRATFPVEKLP